MIRIPYKSIRCQSAKKMMNQLLNRNVVHNNFFCAAACSLDYNKKSKPFYINNRYISTVSYRLLRPGQIITQSKNQKQYIIAILIHIFAFILIFPFILIPSYHSLDLIHFYRVRSSLPRQYSRHSKTSNDGRLKFEWKKYE